MRTLLHSLLLLVLALLVGCGGSGRSQPSTSALGRGAAEFTVVWPEPSRLVPIASTAVKLDVMQGATRVGGAVAVKGSGGSTTVKVESLPVGGLTVNAEAYPTVSFDGPEPVVSGVPQARGTAPLMTEAGKTARTTLTMASTVVRLAISPDPAVVRIGVLNRITLVATAYDAEDRVVLRLPEAQNEWSVADVRVAGVNSRIGTVEGFQEGSTTVTVRDSENGKSASATLTVVKEAPVDQVTLEPASSTLEAGGSATLVARAIDVSGNDLGYTPSRFTWISSLPAALSVDASGKVTASEVESETAVTVTAKDETSGKSASATVIVRPRQRATGRLFFIKASGRQVVSMLPDGSDRQVHARFDSSPGVQELPMAVSHDGRKIYFYRSTYGQLDVWTASLDGSDRRLVKRWEWDNVNRPQDVMNIDYRSFAVSRDDRRAAFVFHGPGVDKISVMVLSLDDGSTRQKESGEVPSGRLYSGTFLDWSPDGQKVAFTTYEASTTRYQVAEWDLSSDDVRHVGTGALGGRYLSDGRSFLVGHQNPGAFNQTFGVGLLSSSGTLGPKVVPDVLLYDVNGAGNRMAYATDAVYTADLDGTGVVKIWEFTGDDDITAMIWTKP